MRFLVIQCPDDVVHQPSMVSEDITSPNGQNTVPRTKKTIVTVTELLDEELKLVALTIQWVSRKHRDVIPYS